MNAIDPHPTYEGKGKARARDDPVAYVRMGLSTLRPRVGPDKQFGFEYKEGVGNVCLVCGKLIRRLDHHITLTDGRGCVDLKTPEEASEQNTPILDPIQPPPSIATASAATKPVSRHAPAPPRRSQQHAPARTSVIRVPSRTVTQYASTATQTTESRRTGPVSGSVDLTLRPTGTNDSLVMEDSGEGEGMGQGQLLPDVDLPFGYVMEK